jgi:hypothetical protein
MADHDSTRASGFGGRLILRDVIGQQGRQLPAKGQAPFLHPLGAFDQNVDEQGTRRRNAGGRERSFQPADWVKNMRNKTSSSIFLALKRQIFNERFA